MFGFDSLQIIVFIFAVIITGISKSGFAGGLGVITVPMLSVVMSPLVAVSIMLPILIIMDMMSLRAWWGKQDNQLLKFLIPAGVLGVFAGYLTFSWVDEATVKVILGVMTLLFGLNGLLSVSSVPAFFNKASVPLGALGGFTSFVAHAGGPPLNFYLLSLKIDKHTYLATAVWFFAIINLAKVPPYIAIGQFSGNNMLIALLSIPISFLGIKLGLIIQQHINETWFFRIVYLLLIVFGLYLCWQTI